MEQITALCYFRKNNIIQQLIHRFKYYQEIEIGILLSKKLAENLKLFHELTQFDLIVPIPIHPKKLKLRGYNQAAVISETIATQLGIAHEPLLLKRSKKISTQTKKSRAERTLTNDNPFELNQKMPNCKHILLVDDIITTGNTLEAASNILLTNNVKVTIATLAFAVKH